MTVSATIFEYEFDFECGGDIVFMKNLLVLCLRGINMRVGLQPILLLPLWLVKEKG